MSVSETLLSKIIRIILLNSRYIITGVVLIMISAILAGSIYAIIEGVPPTIPLRQGGIIVVVSSKESFYPVVKQTGVETLGIAVLLFLGSVGGILMVESPRRIKSQRLANLLFAFGAVLFVASILIIVGIYVYEKGWNLPY